MAQPQFRWYAITEYVHIDTGEIIKKDEYQRGRYRIIQSETKTEIKNEYNRTYGIKTYTRLIREHEQQQLF